MSLSVAQLVLLLSLATSPFTRENGDVDWPVGPAIAEIAFDAEALETAESAAENLASPDFHKREQAERKLENLGTAALPVLQRTYLQTSDLEVRLRIEGLVHRLYLDAHVFSGFGFLGISNSPVYVQHPRIAPKHMGFGIGQIIPGTGAANSDLRAGDIVIELNGEPFPIQADRHVLGERISRNRPGTTVRLTVLRSGMRDPEMRDARVLQIEATLGRVPVERMNQSVRHAFAAEQRALAAFADWWADEFKGGPSSTPSASVTPADATTSSTD